MTNLAISFRRTLQVTGDKPGDLSDIIVRVGFPEPDPVPGGDFRALVAIEGFDQPYSRHFYGVDELQAFLAGCSIVPQILPTLAPAGSRFTWLGSADLGFPAMSAEPSYECTFSPADGRPPRNLSVKVHHPERVDDGWTVLVQLLDHSTWKAIERHEKAETWAKALERGAAAVPAFLAAYVDEHNGGVLEDASGPSCSIGPRSDPAPAVP